MKINKGRSFFINTCVMASIMCATLATPGAMVIAAEFRDRIYGLMTELCPSADICRGAGDDMPIEPPFMFTPCCYDCSCNAGCGNGDNVTCCFPLTDNDRENQDCVYPGSNVPRPNQLHYFMITSPPTTGCVTHDVTEQSSENDALFISSSRQDVDQTKPSLLDFLEILGPVFSPSSGKIYNNHGLAADCYGVNDGVPWPPVFTCDTEKIPDLQLMSSGFEVDELYLEHCKIGFGIPIQIHNLVQSQRCFSGIIDNCNGNTDFIIPEGIQATREEIMSGCENGLSAPYAETYANVFCYICNGETLPDHNFCYDKGGHHSGRDSFYALIDLDVARQEDCRVVHCPSGQVQTETGCTWMFTSPSAGSIIMFLELSAAVPPDECAELPDTYSWRSTQLFVSPWPDEWHIFSLMIELQQSQGNFTDCPQFVVEMRPQFSEEFADVANQYHKYIGQNWTLHYNDAKVVFKQSLTRWSEFAVTVEDSNIIQPMWMRKATNDSIPSGPSYYRLLYQTLDDGGYGKLPVTKTWFCEQVELEPPEYSLLASNRVLRLTRTNTYLFESECALLPVNQQHRPRICLSDSNFRKLDSAASAGTNYRTFIPDMVFLASVVSALYMFL